MFLGRQMGNYSEGTPSNYSQTTSYFITSSAYSRLVFPPWTSAADASIEEHPKSEESSEAEHSKAEATEEVAAEEKAETTEEAAEATAETTEKAAESEQ